MPDDRSVPCNDTTSARVDGNASTNNEVPQNNHTEARRTNQHSPILVSAYGGEPMSAEEAREWGFDAFHSAPSSNNQSDTTGQMAPETRASTPTPAAATTDTDTTNQADASSQVSDRTSSINEAQYSDQVVFPISNPNPNRTIHLVGYLDRLQQQGVDLTPLSTTAGAPDQPTEANTTDASRDAQSAPVPQSDTTSQADARPSRASAEAQIDAGNRAGVTLAPQSATSSSEQVKVTYPADELWKDAPNKPQQDWYPYDTGSDGK